MTRAEALAASPRVAIETPSLKGSIALKGGTIDDVLLVKYRETVKPDSPNVELFSPSGTQHPYFADAGWIAAAGATQKLPDKRYRVDADQTRHPDATATGEVELGQRSGPALQTHDLGRRTLYVRDQ